MLGTQPLQGFMVFAIDRPNIGVELVAKGLAARLLLHRIERGGSRGKIGVLDIVLDGIEPLLHRGERVFPGRKLGLSGYSICQMSSRDGLLTDALGAGLC